MTLSLIVFSALVTLLIACAAAAAESALRIVGRAGRWVWAAAFVLSLIVVAAAPFRRATPDVVVNTAGLAGVKATSAIPPMVQPTLLARIMRDPATFVGNAFRAVADRLPPASGRYLLAAWLFSSMLFGMLYFAVHLRMRFARRSWPHTDIDGATVRVAPAAGPAVFGVLHPEIIVPRWLLSRDTIEQRLVVAHETEHLRAGDHLLLAAAGLAVVLMPWNPAVWWMFSRLRLAIELDCDARVLGMGVAPRSYGTLLIDLAEQSHGLRLGAPALIDGSSHLHTRVMAMKRQTGKFARVRGSLVGFAALSLLVVACEAKLPTSAEVENMDVAGAEKALTMAQLPTANVTYQIDGVAATAEQAHALRADQIASMYVSQAANGAAGKLIRITTGTPQRRLTVSDAKTSDSARTALQAAAAKAVNYVDNSPRSVVRVRGPALGSFTGLLVVDGSIVDPSTFKQLDPDNVESIDVLKGAAAMAEYKDARAANGVIVIKTKKAP